MERRAALGKARGQWLAAAAAAILLGVAAGGIVLLRRHAAPEAQAVPSASAAVSAAPEVSLTGKVAASRTVDVAAPIEGTIESMDVEAGAEVFEGQLLARIRNQGIEAGRERAKEEQDRAQTRLNNLESTLIAARLEASRAAADAGRARDDFDRAEKLALREQMLFKSGATPRLKHDKAQTDWQTARQEYETLRARATVAEDRIEKYTRDLDAARRVLEEKTQEMEDADSDLLAGDLLSPVDGTVVATRARAGDEVTPAIENLIQIAVDLSQLLVVLEPEPPLLARIKPEMPVAIHIAEAGDESFAGTVKEIKDSQVIIEFASPNAAVKPGLTAQVRIRF